MPMSFLVPSVSTSVCVPSAAGEALSGDHEALSGYHETSFYKLCYM